MYLSNLDVARPGTSRRDDSDSHSLHELSCRFTPGKKKVVECENVSHGRRLAVEAAILLWPGTGGGYSRPDWPLRHQRPGSCPGGRI